VNQFLTTVGKAISKLNPNDVRAQSERPVHIGLAAIHEFRQAEMKRFLLPDGMSKQRMIESAAHIHQINPEVTIPQFDVDLWEEGISKGPQGFTFYAAAPKNTIEQILDKKEDLGLPLARQFPAFRPAVVDKIIQGICQENAMFAIATSLPGIIPAVALPLAVGEFATDTAFLTMNQMRMAFMLAAASDRNIGYGEQKSEIASVIAGAFGWRAIARECVGKIPFGGGIIPKAAISYAGTWVVGKSLERLYSVGYGYSRSERGQVYDQGFEQGKKVAAKFLEKVKGKAAS
jgi:hypothetical protein